MTEKHKVGITSKNSHICGLNYQPEIKVDDPQVWIRLRPSPKFSNNVFEVGDDGKSLRIQMSTGSTGLVYQEQRKRILSFPTDGVLYNSTQEDSFRRLAYDLVEKAMTGISGVILSLGPEISGKGFTMYGPPGKYLHRGLIPRTLEHIYLTIENKSHQLRYQVFIGAVEIRKDHVKDLITLSPYEINTIGATGPRGMALQQIFSVDQGLALLNRALSSQKKLPRGFSRVHTIIYLDIYADAFLETNHHAFQSRASCSDIL